MNLWGSLDFRTMGIFALCVFWLNVGLVIAAAVRDASKVRARLAQASRLGVLRVRIQGKSGPFARLVVEQSGRAALDADVIHFHDRHRQVEILGGRVESDGESIEVPATDEAELWIEPDALRVTEREPSFDDALAAARRARGLERVMAYEITPAQELWAIGKLERDGDEARLLAPAPFPLVLSLVEPRAWMRERLRLTAIMIVLWILGGAATTALTLVPPVFGVVSAIGGVACVVFFLGGLLPWGVWLRERVSPPGRRPVRGRRVRPIMQAATAS